jgi:1-acyl-sn-glycerol-3-phosphate acyltransferase
MFFYWFVCTVLYFASRIAYKVRISGTENIPKEGAFILCCNHIHSYDPAMFAINIKRRLNFMAKKELFRKRPGRWFFSKMGAFPVDRKATDMTSYRKAMEVLKSGRGLLIFSQGTRMQELNIKGAKGGVALFAVKGRVPVIPAGITCEYNFRDEMYVRFGKPISLEEYYNKRLKTEEIEIIMEGIMSEVEKLLG